jgi:hypothetical protein
MSVLSHFFNLISSLEDNNAMIERKARFNPSGLPAKFYRFSSRPALNLQILESIKSKPLQFMFDLTAVVFLSFQVYRFVFEFLLG